MIRICSRPSLAADKSSQRFLRLWISEPGRQRAMSLDRAIGQLVHTLGSRSMAVAWLVFELPPSDASCLPVLDGVAARLLHSV